VQCVSLKMLEQNIPDIPRLSEGGGVTPNKEMQRYLRTRRGGGGWSNIR